MAVFLAICPMADTDTVNLTESHSMQAPKDATCDRKPSSVTAKMHPVPSQTECIANVPQQKSPTIICAENIALLQFLHNVPAQPSTRILRAAVENDGHRALSFEQERQLTGALAVLSSIRENANLTTAVAVREVLCDGLGRIFNTLSQATSGKSSSRASCFCSPSEVHDSQLEYQVFIDIVSVCRGRILSLLRFGKHQRGKTKPPFRNVLRDMCDAVASIRHRDARAFLKGTRRLVAALKRFENHQTDAELPTLVEEAHTWTRMGDLTSLFHRVPFSALGGASCEDYRRIISKIGQYRTAARHDDFVRITYRILAEGKLHAEVQVLAYLKSLSHHDALGTRVIQSNKKACFLCDEVLALNGLPGVPKSHGRLYSGWMLPSLPGLKQLQLQLNDSLQRRANRSIDMVLRKGQKIDLVFPVESTALTVSEVAVAGIEQSESVSAPSIEILSAPVTTSKPETLGEDEELKMPEGPVHGSAEDSSSVISEVDSAEVLTLPYVDVMLDDANGSQDSQPSYSVSPGETYSIHTFGGSEMTIQYSTGPGHPKPASALVYRIRQLDKSDVEVLKSQDVRICDVTSLDKGSEVTLVGLSPFYVDLRSTAAELMFYE
ncbi:uncharacterized protein VDAG_02364 [Verticillium dahliae VdLs.17]|uniref:Uncharacterized protein n=1 Tax=Verticillium dahliae (strain VdLs.17 / ATCC MYA-4575 / FGSC 10137) TaxID=498257 RepID=G2WXN2_VERDV|nr:uncharacterized protein VDAG_02364 [Verticillium dahliae VdLs.17]EGY20840.1 hypothetical protein VDAG_02364 [Verticillium dahliae VdLs.17]